MRRRDYTWNEVLEFIKLCDHKLKLDPDETLKRGTDDGYAREDLLLAFKKVNRARQQS